MPGHDLAVVSLLRVPHALREDGSLSRLETDAGVGGIYLMRKNETKYRNKHIILKKIVLK